MVAEGNPYKCAAVSVRRIRKRDSQRLDDSIRIEALCGAAGRQKKSDRMSEIHPVAIQFGVPRSKPMCGRAGGDGASGHKLIFKREMRYTAKPLETAKSCEIIRVAAITQNH